MATKEQAMESALKIAVEEWSLERDKGRLRVRWVSIPGMSNIPSNCLDGVPVTAERMDLLYVVGATVVTLDSPPSAIVGVPIQDGVDWITALPGKEADALDQTLDAYCRVTCGIDGRNCWRRRKR